MDGGRDQLPASTRLGNNTLGALVPGVALSEKQMGRYDSVGGGYGLGSEGVV